MLQNRDLPVKVTSMLEFLPYQLTHERLKEAVEKEEDGNTLLRLALDAEEALTAYRERLERT